MLLCQRVKALYNRVRHEGIGYITPNDEHEGAAPPFVPHGSRASKSLTNSDATGSATTGSNHDYHHQQQPANNRHLLSESTQQLRSSDGASSQPETGTMTLGVEVLAK